MPPPRAKKPKSPGQSPDPSPGDEAHSAASSTDSARASQADAPPSFLGDPGPAFTGDGEEAPAPAPEPEPELHALPGLEPEWEEEALSRVLLAKGELLHTFVGVAENDWRYTEADLKAIAPPLSRILNRYPATRAAAGSQDPLALAIATSAYAIRSGRERVVALRALEEAEVERPITGADAPPGAAPPPGHPLHEAPEPPARPADQGDPEALEWQRA